MIRKLLAGACALGLGLGVLADSALAAKTYGGISYAAEDPWRYGGTIYHDFWYSGTATVTGTLYLRSVLCDPSCSVVAKKDITLLRGVKYNAVPQLTVSCWAGRGTLPLRSQAKFAGGSWDVSNTKTFYC